MGSQGWWTLTNSLLRLWLWKSPCNPGRKPNWLRSLPSEGLKANELVQQVLSQYLEDDTRFIEAVNLGLAAADHGEFVEHEEVGRTLKEILLP